MILGGEDSPQVVAGLREVKSLEIAPYRANWKDQISDKEIRAAVEIPPGFQVALEKGEPKTVKIYYHEGEMKSSFGVDRIEKFLKDYRDRVVKDRLAAKNVPISVLTPFEIRQENVAPPEKVSGATVGGKERGTMETILSSPISRMNLVLGKFLLVLSAALATAALSVMSMGISFAALRRFNMSSGRGDAAALLLKLGPKAVASIFLMALPMAVLFSAMLMTIALFAKSHKEAQSYLTPMTFLVVIPAVASLLPGVELTPKLAFIPILNTSLVCKEIMTGTYHWNAIALIFVSTCAYAAGALFLAFKTFQRESVLFRS